MKSTKQLLKEKEATENLIKHVEKGFGRDKCKSYVVGCANCEGQILLGYLDWYLDLLNWELEDKKDTQTGSKTKYKLSK